MNDDELRRQLGQVMNILFFLEPYAPSNLMANLFVYY